MTHVGRIIIARSRASQAVLWTGPSTRSRNGLMLRQTRSYSLGSRPKVPSQSRMTLHIFRYRHPSRSSVPLSSRSSSKRLRLEGYLAAADLGQRNIPFCPSDLLTLERSQSLPLQTSKRLTWPEPGAPAVRPLSRPCASWPSLCSLAWCCFVSTHSWWKARRSRPDTPRRMYKERRLSLARSCGTVFWTMYFVLWAAGTMQSPVSVRSQSGCHL